MTDLMCISLLIVLSMQFIMHIQQKFLFLGTEAKILVLNQP